MKKLLKRIERLFKPLYLGITYSEDRKHQITVCLDGRERTIDYLMKISKADQEWYLYKYRNYKCKQLTMGIGGNIIATFDGNNKPYPYHEARVRDARAC